MDWTLRSRLVLLWTVITFLSTLVGCSSPSIDHPRPLGAEQAVQSAETAVVPEPKGVLPAPRQSSSPDMVQLQTQLRKFLAAQNGIYGLYVIDLVSGKTASVNGEKLFPAASTIKLPLALYVLDQVARKRVTMDQHLVYTEADYEDGTGILQDEALGSAFSIRYLLEISITYSDNIATNILLRRFGAGNVWSFARRLGARRPNVMLDGHLATTPQDMAFLMRKAHDGRVLPDEALRDFLSNTLAGAVFHGRIDAGIPPGIIVEHKVGTLPNVVNDVAMVRLPGRPFVLSVFSQGVEEETAEAVLAEIARRVYLFEGALIQDAANSSDPVSPRD